jgi:cytochrome c peroxidase
MKQTIVILAILLAAIGGCDTASTPPLELPVLVIPTGFPSPVFPADNEFTIERFNLGKKLFYDSILSRTGTVSCASCHRQSLAFSDDVPTSKGVENQLGTRNSPSLANIAYHPYFTREGGVPTLEQQILVPIQEHNEFDNNILRIADKIALDSTYIRMAKAAYNREPDPYIITRSIACFERALLSGNSRYDQSTFQGQSGALSAAELRGKDLFFSARLACANCHSGFNFTNYSFANNGLYQYYTDPGRFRLTHNPSDSARFKVPSLRNVGLTAPYMHDGSIATLAGVIDHYNSGGAPHKHKSEFVKPLNLTAQEKQDLLEFLMSLTDNDFIHNRNFAP